MLPASPPRAIVDALGAGLRIDHDVGGAGLVRHEHLVRLGREGDAVGKANVADARRDLERAVVDDRDFVGAGRRHVDLMMRRHRQHAGRAREIRDLRDDATAVRVEDDRTAGVHVIHIDAPRHRIEALVVEPVCGTGQRDLANEREAGRRARLASRGPARDTTRASMTLASRSTRAADCTATAMVASAAQYHEWHN